MQYNHDSRNTFERVNLFKLTILGLFYSICSYPRLLIEVFIRVNFGQRYFNWASAATVALILFFTPVYLAGGWDRFELLEGIKYHPTWYIYLAAFLYCSYLRYWEIRQSPGAYDFARYSRSLGYLNDKIVTHVFERFNIWPTIRTCEIWLEPLPFFLVGAVMAFSGMILGYLLVFCSICYSVSYMAAYYIGDSSILDMIDKMLIGQQLRGILVEGKGPKDAKGVNMYFSERPTDKEWAERLANKMRGKDKGKDDDDDSDAVPVN